MPKRILPALGSAFFLLLILSVPTLKADTYSSEIASANQIGDEIDALQAATESSSIRMRDRRRLEYRLRIAKHYLNWASGNYNDPNPSGRNVNSNTPGITSSAI